MCVSVWVLACLAAAMAQEATVSKQARGEAMRGGEGRGGWMTRILGICCLHSKQALVIRTIQVMTSMSVCLLCP